MSSALTTYAITRSRAGPLRGARCSRTAPIASTSLLKRSLSSAIDDLHALGLEDISVLGRSRELPGTGPAHRESSTFQRWELQARKVRPAGACPFIARTRRSDHLDGDGLWGPWRFCMATTSRSPSAEQVGVPGHRAGKRADMHHAVGPDVDDFDDGLGLGIAAD